MNKLALFVVFPLCVPASAWATDFNDKTGCDALTRSVNAQDVMDARRSSRYILDALQSLDRVQAFAGHQPIVNLLSAAETRTMVWDVVTLCASEPKLTVRNAAGAVYITASMFGPS